MNKEQCKGLVGEIFGPDAANSDDIVSWYMEVNKTALEELREEFIELCRKAHSDGWTKQLTTTDSWHNPSWLEFKEKHGL